MATKQRQKNAPATGPASTAAKAETCFTIMPFGGWFDSYYESIFVPAIKAAGLIPCRADDLYRPSTIVHDIWAYTRQAKLVLADLSGKNPNVFYELGLAHALAKPAILVTESIDDVPFDLRALRVLEYNKNEPRWGDVLQAKISSAIKEVVSAPLQSVLPAFLDVRSDAKSKPISEHERLLLELRRELDLLRGEVARVRYPRRPILNPDNSSLTPDEARERIRAYLTTGMPPDVIAERLADRGPPISWILSVIDELRGGAPQDKNAQSDKSPDA